MKWSESHSVVSNSLQTPWTVVCQAPLSMGFPRQEYWSGLPFSSLGDLPNSGLNLCLLYWQADSLPLSTWILFTWLFSFSSLRANFIYSGKPSSIFYLLYNTSIFRRINLPINCVLFKLEKVNWFFGMFSSFLQNYGLSSELGLQCQQFEHNFL